MLIGGPVVYSRLTTVVGLFPMLTAPLCFLASADAAKEHNINLSDTGCA
jgi:hypothetical protein